MRAIIIPDRELQADRANRQCQRKRPQRRLCSMQRIALEAHSFYCVDAPWSLLYRMVGAGTTGDANPIPVNLPVIHSICLRSGYNAARRPQGPQRPRLGHCHSYGHRQVTKDIYGGQKINGTAAWDFDSYWGQSHWLYWVRLANHDRPHVRRGPERRTRIRIRTHNDNRSNLLE